MEAAAMELEDDVFFADLSRQISLLIMDDEDVETSTTHCSSVSLQVILFGLSSLVQPQTFFPSRKSSTIWFGYSKTESNVCHVLP
nr:DNA polymerase epsilon subunit B like [Ipomoea batatas]